MSLNDIHLSPFLVEQLYKKTLVDVNPLKPVILADKTKSISFLGKNEKEILLVVNETETVFLSDVDLNLLVSILSACKLTLADVALINFDKNKTASYNILMEKFVPKCILLFGVNPTELSFPLHFPKYQLQQYNNQTYVCSTSLKVLGEDISQKKELWLCLQKYFFNP